MIGTATIKARPLKMALLVEPHNALQVREAMQFACSLWGGTFFPILPVYKRMPAGWSAGSSVVRAGDVFEGYIEAFDPDLLVQFTSHVPAYVTATGIKVIQPSDVWRSGTAAEPRYGISILAVMNDVYEKCFRYVARYPTSFVVPAIPKHLGLFWSSVFGEFPENVTNIFERYYSSRLDTHYTAASPAAFLEFTQGDVLSPRRITAWGLSWHMQRHARTDCLFYMDGASVEDITDFWNLRATGRSVLPIPRQLIHDEHIRSAVKNFIIAARHPWPHNPDIFDVASFVPSRNCTPEEMEIFAKALDLPALAKDSQYHYLVQSWYPRIWDGWARGHDGGVADVYAEGEDSIDVSRSTDAQLQLKPLIPAFAQDQTHSSQAICANELELHLYGADEYLAAVFPKTGGENLAGAVAGLTREWRIGRHGLVRLVNGTWIETRTATSSETVFFAWLADHGWTAQLSPPGILAKHIYKILGGYPRLILNQPLLSLLEHMNGGVVSLSGLKPSNEKLSGPREMSVGEIKGRLKHGREPHSLYSSLIEKGVFKLGLRTQCPTCQRNTWFPIASLRDQLECPKCLSVFSAVGNIDQLQPSWHYRTSGPFSVANYADGAYTVLASIEVLSAHGLGLETTAVPSFIASAPGRSPIEADFAMFWREGGPSDQRSGLLFGECKSYGLFKSRDIFRMKSLGESFPGAVLVFSTFRESLTTAEIKAITRLAKAGRKYWKDDRPINPVLILTGTELFSWQSPPHCWDDPSQENFSHVHGLLSLCDATQQRYLGLPSWRDLWREKWQQRAERRASRNLKGGER